MAKNSVKYLAFIDALRGVCIFVVLFGHIYNEATSAPSNARSLDWPLLSDFIRGGFLGLWLFFILSAYSLFRTTDSRTGTEETPILNFYIRRIFRIIPLWWSTTLLSAVVHGYKLSDIAANFFMYFGFLKYQRPKEVIMGEWSLFVEESFYIFFPLLFIRVRNLKSAFTGFLVTYVVSILWREYAAKLGVPTSYNFIQCVPLYYWHFFFVGILLYHFLRQPRSLQILDNPRRANLLAAVTLILLPFTIFLHKVPALKLFHDVIALGVLALFFYCSSSEKNFLGRFMKGSAFFQGLGVLCYPIYVTHGTLITLTDGFRIWLLQYLGVYYSPQEIRFLVWFPIFFVLQILLAVLMHTLIEKPGMKLGRQILRRRKFDHVHHAGVAFPPNA